jgi:hypothetical protein
MVLHKLADGVYWTEDADGRPAALATTLDDGVTSLKAAEQWWAVSQRLLEWVASAASREWNGQAGLHEGPGGPADA